MTWRIVELRQVVPSAWKNGGGTTRELMAWPDARDWIWRMSVAQVTGDGPFSRFDGVRRWFAVLHGAGVVLASNGQRRSLTATSAPHSFDGADTTGCELIDGPTSDFNLMTRSIGPSAMDARMTRVRGSASLQLRGTGVLAVYAADAAARVRLCDQAFELAPDCLAWCAAHGTGPLQLDATHALVMEIEPQLPVAGGGEADGGSPT